MRNTDMNKMRNIQGHKGFNIQIYINFIVIILVIVVQIHPVLCDWMLIYTDYGVEKHWFCNTYRGDVVHLTQTTASSADPCAHRPQRWFRTVPDALSTSSVNPLHFMGPCLGMRRGTSTHAQWRFPGRCSGSIISTWRQEAGWTGPIWSAL